MIFQRTLKHEVKMEGVGLHSGKTAHLTIRPALPNHGITFVRTDLKDSQPLAANYINVTNTQMATTIGRGNVTISTVEHVLAALQLMGIDNAVVEIDGPEIPIMDGSSAAFCEAIEKTGLQSQLQARPYLSIRKKVEVKMNEKWASIEPCSRLEIFASIDWDHPAIGYQEFRYVEGQSDYQEIANARTFGFLKDYEALKKMGLARGGSLDNAVVLDHAMVMNPDGLRSPDEFVRHKVLDALGDFKLAGIGVLGYVRLHRAGHEVHSRLLSAVFKDPNNYEIINSGIAAERKERSLGRTRALVSRRFAVT